MKNSRMNPKVDQYLTEGCGRCPLVGTPDCKVNKWPTELRALRTIVLECGLTEEVKWGIPCYTFEKSNVVTISALNEYCALGFFKGALLKDDHHILEKPGENTQAARRIRFTNVQQIIELEPVLKAYINEAMEIEKAGLKVEFKKSPEPIPEELQKKFDEMLDLKTAFESLTPGRQRAYILYFSGAKQSKTREARIEKHIQRIPFIFTPRYTPEVCPNASVPFCIKEREAFCFDKLTYKKVHVDSVFHRSFTDYKEVVKGLELLSKNEKWAIQLTEYKDLKMAERLKWVK